MRSGLISKISSYKRVQGGVTLGLYEIAIKPFELYEIDWHSVYNKTHPSA